MRLNRRTLLQVAAAAVAFPACQLSTTAAPSVSAGPVATSAEGLRAEVDVLRHRLRITGPSGELVVGGIGLGRGQLNGPAGVVALNGLFYVVETGNHRVQAFDGRGRSVEVLVGPGLAYPRGLTRSGDRLLIADSRNARLVELDPRTGQHRVLGAGLLSAPCGLAVQDDAIVVADPGLGKVLELDRDGHLRRELGEGWVLPHGVAMDGEVTFVVDTAASEVAVLDAAGRRQSSLSLSSAATFVSLGADGRLVVA